MPPPSGKHEDESKATHHAVKESAAAAKDKKTGPETHTVTFSASALTPAHVAVKVNDVVQWVNNSDTVHIVKFTNAPEETEIPPTSGDIRPGSSYPFTFAKAGTWEYQCEVHPNMRGTVVVS